MREQRAEGSLFVTGEWIRFTKFVNFSTGIHQVCQLQRWYLFLHAELVQEWWGKFALFHWWLGWSISSSEVKARQETPFNCFPLFGQVTPFYSIKIECCREGSGWQPKHVTGCIVQGEKERVLLWWNLALYYKFRVYGGLVRGWLGLGKKVCEKKI